MVEHKALTHAEYQDKLRKELNEIGLKAAIKKRCDMIDEDCRFLRTATYLGVIENLNDILDLLTIAEEKINDD